MCVKDCPATTGGTFADGAQCKDNDKVKCDEAKIYKTINVFDFCIPASQDALSAEEWAGV